MLVVHHDRHDRYQEQIAALLFQPTLDIGGTTCAGILWLDGTNNQGRSQVGVANCRRGVICAIATIFVYQVTRPNRTSHGNLSSNTSLTGKVKRVRSEGSAQLYDSTRSVILRSWPPQDLAVESTDHVDISDQLGPRRIDSLSSSVCNTLWPTHSHRQDNGR